MKKQQRIFAIIVIALVLMMALYALGAASMFRNRTAGTYFAEGMEFTGELGDGKFQGEGKIVFANGDTYEGALVRGRFEGFGVYASSEGWRYEGKFSQGKPIDPGNYHER